MIDWKRALVRPEEPIIEVINKINKSALQVALVIDSNNYLLGIVTDGDIRRGILKGISLDNPVEKVMKRKPIVASIDQSRDEMLKIMKAKKISQLPITDLKGHIVGLELLSDLIAVKTVDNWVILMAGGLGKRLSPITDNCPKPMIRIGGKPVLETILNNFIEQGFKNFYIAVNHLPEQITTYFGDGSKWDVSISYIVEKKKMGTAGAVSLLQQKPTETFIVMNGDLLTKVNYNLLLEYHNENRAMATMCVREHSFQIPYGVVKINNSRIEEIKEKPVQRCFVNAGIYVLEPQVLEFVSRKDYLDMTTLFETMILKGVETTVYPIREYWVDIGYHADLEKADTDYLDEFRDD